MQSATLCGKTPERSLCSLSREAGQTAGVSFWALALRADSAGAAKPFVEPRGDNSIPTFGSEAAGSDRSRAEAALRGPILTLRIKGQSGFALFYGLHRQKYVMPMAREGGAWKVTQLAPIAYPLGSETQTSP